MLKKADILLIAALVIFAAVFVFLFDFTNTETKGGLVIVIFDGQKYGEYPLDTPNFIDINNSEGKTTNKLEISNGKVKMIYAVCPDEQCIKQGEISFSNETIVCLPNKVVVEIINGVGDEFDGIVQ